MRNGRLTLLLIFFLATLCTCYGCRHKERPAMVDMEQIEPDGSTDDRYLFRDDIRKQEERDNRYKKEKF